VQRPSFVQELSKLTRLTSLSFGGCPADALQHVPALTSLVEFSVWVVEGPSDSTTAFLTLLVGNKSVLPQLQRLHLGHAHVHSLLQQWAGILRVSRGIDMCGKPFDGF
jgi:hypothetical protein